MKRITGLFWAVCLAVIMAAGLIPLPVRAAGGNISLSVSSSSVNIGDTITVTVNGSADEEALIQVNVSCAGGAEYTGSGNSGAILEPSAGGSDSATLTYRATSPGTVTFSASVVQAYSVETAEPISVADASAAVTIKNEAGGGSEGGSGGGNSSGSGGGSSGGSGGGNSGGSGGGNSGGSGGNTVKSADNSLRSLSISPGTLSPAFKYSTVNYTASVGADVTSIAVDAQVSNAKASVESVTGHKDLKPGNNTIKIVVKAENGTVATYTIVVNRGAAASEEPGEEEPEEPGEEEPNEAPQGDITVGGRSYRVSAAFPEGVQLPEGFEKATATYEGEEVEVYNFFYGNLKLYYLTEAVPEGTEQGHDGCYFYDEGTSAFFPYINIPVGGGYVVVLPTSYNSEGIMPEGYETAEVMMGENTIDGLRLSELYSSGVDGAGDFYLVYGVNKDGIPGWYQYDRVEGSLQRYVQLRAFEQPQEEEEEEPQQPAFDEEQYKREYQKLLEEYQEQKGRAQIMMFALVAVVVVAIIILVVLLVSGRGKRGKGGTEEDQDIDFIDFDDL